MFFTSISQYYRTRALFQSYPATLNTQKLPTGPIMLEPNPVVDQCPGGTRDIKEPEPSNPDTARPGVQTTRTRLSLQTGLRPNLLLTTMSPYEETPSLTSQLIQVRRYLFI
jgi:hypothetical protein